MLRSRFDSASPISGSDHTFVLRCFFFFFLLIRRPPISTLFPSTTLSRSLVLVHHPHIIRPRVHLRLALPVHLPHRHLPRRVLPRQRLLPVRLLPPRAVAPLLDAQRSEEHTSELQSQSNLVCRLLLEKKKP